MAETSTAPSSMPELFCSHGSDGNCSVHVEGGRLCLIKMSCCFQAGLQLHAHLQSSSSIPNSSIAYCVLKVRSTSFLRIFLEVLLLHPHR